MISFKCVPVWFVGDVVLALAEASVMKDIAKRLVFEADFS